jgi:hypothetical protein
MVVVQEEGDFLFFPPHWGHSVVTQAGPNVMLNLRQAHLSLSFMRQPWRMIETLLSMASIKASRHIFNPQHLNPVQRILLFGSVANSVCESVWSVMLRK